MLTMRRYPTCFYLPPLLILFSLTACIRSNTINLESLTPLTADQLSEIKISDHTDLSKITFLVLGDMGTGGANQQAVADAMVEFCDQPANSCDFIIALGDNIYRDGVDSPADSKLLTRFEQPYENLGRIDMWLTPGNHDWLRADSVQSEIDYTTLSDRWRMPHNHFAIPQLPPWLNIYSVDTTLLHIQSWQIEDPILNTSTADMLTGAQSGLCDKPGWRILFGHHPIYTSGKHGLSAKPAGIIDSIQQSLSTVVEECDVQVYMAGHDHHQELIQVDGFTQIIQGAGGRYLRTIPDSADLLGTRWSVERFGFAAITATSDQLAIAYFGIDSHGDGWEKLCDWTLSLDGSLQSGPTDCNLSD